MQLLRRQGDEVLIRAPGLDGREGGAGPHAGSGGAGILVNPIRPAEADAPPQEPDHHHALDDVRRARA